MSQPVAGHAIQAGPELWEDSTWNVCPLAMLGDDGAGGRVRDPSLAPAWLAELWRVRQWLAEGRPLDDFCGALSAAGSAALLALDGELADRDRMELAAARKG